METLCPSFYIPNPNWFVQESNGTNWSREENKMFESALAIYDKETPDRWLKVAALIPGKTVLDVMKQYQELEEDVSDIEAGLVPVPGYLTSAFTLEMGDARSSDPLRKRSSADRADHERKKGVPWTEDEHRRFLLGLLKHGKGDWRNISRNFVVSKTPTQVASHAQKYFMRQNSGGKDKRRPSIHDITTVNLSDATPSNNNKPPLLDQSIVLPLQKKFTGSPSVLNWDHQNNGAVMVFDPAHGNMFMPPPYEYEFASHGLKLQTQNLYGGAHLGAIMGPHSSVFQVQPTRYQIRG